LGRRLRQRADTGSLLHILNRYHDMWNDIKSAGEVRRRLGRAICQSFAVASLVLAGTAAADPAAAWVDPLTGRLMRVELTVASPAEPFGPVTHVAFTATIVVEFSPEPRLGLWVPSKMTERYSSLPCSGEATYTNYRTFTVQTRIIP